MFKQLNHLCTVLALTFSFSGIVAQDISFPAFTITSGEPVTCEHKFKDPFNMRPVCTIWLASNHMPRTKDFSPALFRRALIIPFNRVFEEHEQDKTLKSKLTSELPGILNLALAGMKNVFNRGYFTEPESCKGAKAEWRLHADQAAEYVSGRCVTGPGYSIPIGNLFNDYLRWAEDNGIKRTLGKNTFSTRIVNLGCERKQGSHGGPRMMVGIDTLP